MKYRKLRIAWSAVCAVLCLLLLALWVRSYWWNDVLSISFDGNRAYIIRSVNGEFALFLEARASHAHGPRWASERSIGNLRSPPSVLGFRWGVARGLRWPVVPQWFPVALTAPLAALPWMKSSFSLRTLLIGITLVAAALGAVICTVK